jgi:hypothetical protein
MAKAGNMCKSFSQGTSMTWKRMRNQTSKLGTDGWRVVDDYYGQTVGKLQAESMMSTAVSLFPQYETKV